MCGRFTLTNDDRDWLALEFGLPREQLEEISELVVPRFNIAPMQPHWVVVADREERWAMPATWGFVDGRAGRHINARGEDVERRPAFGEAFAARRCVVPADGFFEWSGDRRGGGARRPFWFHRPDRGALRFAGLYSERPLDGSGNGKGGAAPTFAIVTTQANGLVGHIHDRMPVLLPDDGAAEAWLYPRQHLARLRDLLRPVSDGYLVARPVSTRVNSVQHDDAACLAEGEAGTQGALL